MHLSQVKPLMRPQSPADPLVAARGAPEQCGGTRSYEILKGV